MLNSPLPPDITVTDRLQMVIAEWKGAQAGHTLARLYQDCLDLVGPDKHLLPIRIMAVRELDSESLDRALKRYRMPLEYDIDTIGRFEAAMVPVLRESGPAAGFLFVYEEELDVQNQVALFAHAVGHLILNHQEHLKEHELPLDPESGAIHTDRLAELRYLDIAKNRNLLDRQVLDAFPTLTHLIELPEESQVKLETVTRALDPWLRRQGWVQQFVRVPYRYTQGRVIPNSQQRGKRMTIDALLRVQASLPIAVVHVQRQEEKREEAIGRVCSAAQQLSVPFAYILTQQKDIIELHWLNGSLADPQVRATLPDRAELQRRWLSALQLTDPKEADTLSYPYDLTQRPRYYQETAINQAVIAVLQARKGLRERRILLTLATGTGKTQVAFQILWKLKKTYRVRNVLFLADRGYLLEQAQTNTFGPFGDAIVRGMGEIDTAHDILFGSYQWLTTTQDGVERYEGYPSDYFDVIIIDECHRGSADDNSKWRKVLAHFSEAIQIGLTATPLETRDVQTNKYFGPSVYTYTLSQGINDGYLAPYSVRRVLIEKEQPTNEAEQPALLPANKPVETLDQQIVMQTGNTMCQYTQTIAEHLSRYLQLQTDPREHKTIVFCVDNTHADQMRLALEKACASWARPGDIVRIVDDDGIEGKRALSQFCTIRERQPVIVTTARLLTTGVDVPTCKNIVLARGVGSIVEFKQIIGRGTRLSLPDKRWFTILDYAGAIKHFSDPAFDGDPTSVQREYLIPASKDVDEATPPTNEHNTPTLVDAGIRTETDPSLSTISQPTDGREAEDPDHPATSDEQGANVPNVQVEPPPNENGEYNGSGASPAVNQSGMVKECQQGLETQALAPDAAGTIPLDAEYEYSASEEIDTSKKNTPEQPDPPLEVIQANQNIQPADQATVSAVRFAAQSTTDIPLEREQTHTPKRSQQAQKAPKPKAADMIVEKANGNRFVVGREFTYELDASGTKLREGTNQEFAQKALKDLIKAPDDLRAYWTDRRQRELLIEQLTSEVVALDALAQALHLPDVDHYDLLLQVLFQLPTITRLERVQRLQATHNAFFQRFEHNQLAKELLDAILEKYIQGDAPDVSDIGLLTVPPLNVRTRMEWARAFSQASPPTSINTVLKELQQLLYSV